jgi:hypothetical protein
LPSAAQPPAIGLIDAAAGDQLDSLTRSLFRPEPGPGPDGFGQKREDGFLQVPHEINSWAQRAVTRRYDTLVFNCLLRFSLGYRQDFCQVGLNRISSHTGITDKANCARSIKNLARLQFVKIVQDPDLRQNRATVYQVAVVTAYYRRRQEETGTAGIRFWDDLKKTGAAASSPAGLPAVVPADTGVSPDQRSPGTPTGSLGGHPRVSPGTTIKYNIKDNERDSLSEAAWAEPYLLSIKAGGQRQKERESLLRLMADGIAPATIERCVRELRHGGIPPRGEPCLLPLTWLYASGSSLIYKHSKPAAAASREEPAPEEPRLGDGHPLWPEYLRWRDKLSEAELLSLLAAEAGETPGAARARLLALGDATRRVFVEASLRAAFARERDIN